MAQSGFTPIQLYRSSTASSVPQPENLTLGELALNTTDENLYFKNTGGIVKTVGANLVAAQAAALAASGGAGLVGYIAEDTGSVATTSQQVMRESISAFRFMTPTQIADVIAGTLTLDMTVPLNLAATAMKVRGGGKVTLPHGKYRVDGFIAADGIRTGLLIPFTSGSDIQATAVSIDFVGEDRDTGLYAGNNDMILVRHSSSYSDFGNMQLMVNGKTGVQGLCLIPENTTNPALNSQQSFNNIHDLYISEFDEGITIQCGGNGGAYYNHFRNIHVHGGSKSNTRGVWLKSGVSAQGGGVPSSCNRNQFYSVRVGYTNVGIHIESGDTNAFFGCSLEGVQVAIGKFAVATGLKIDAVDANGRSNQGNTFHSFTAEACTRDAEILDPRTSFYGFILNASKTILAVDFVSGMSGVAVGSYDNTVFPNIYAGTLEYGSLLPAGIGAYEFGSASNQTDRFDRGHKYKSYPLSTANVGGVTSIGQAKSYYTKFAGMVDFSFRFSFGPVATGSTITVPLPVATSGPAYSEYSIISPFVFPVYIVAGNTKAIGFAEVNFESPAGTFLKVTLPSGVLWNNAVASNNNVIHAQIRYRAA